MIPLADIKEVLVPLVLASKILFANSRGCVSLHHCVDVDLNGLPPWLADAEPPILAGEALLARIEEEEGACPDPYSLSPDPNPFETKGGDATAHGPRPDPRPHVTPPASADQGSGRAIAEQVAVNPSTREMLLPFIAEHLNSGGVSWGGLSNAVAHVLASEYSRGEAAGRLSGIEEAAKVADEHPDQVLAIWDRPGGPPGNGFVPATPKHVASAIRQRALTPGGTT